MELNFPTLLLPFENGLDLVTHFQKINALIRKNSNSKQNKTKHPDKHYLNQVMKVNLWCWAQQLPMYVYDEKDTSPLRYSSKNP